DRSATMQGIAGQLGATRSPGQLARAAQTRIDATRADIRLRADAVATLARLRAAGMITGLVSDCTHEIPMIMPELPIAKLLEVTVFSVVLGSANQHPALFPPP